jgi:quercetin dioxygenase-like cupin family protein
MSITHLYTGSDGQSHLEELDLASHPELTELLTTKGIVFRTAQPGHFSDWHNAPRRQFVITVSGEAEIGLA